MRVTDQALQALVSAAGEAHGRGDEQVSGYHLLLALAGADGGARHVLALAPDRLRDAPAPGAPHPFPAAREVVDTAVAHAHASGRDQATTADILAAALGAEDGPAALLLSAAGAEPAKIRAALAESDHDACCGETGISALRPVLAEMGAQAGQLPGRGRAVARLLGGLVPYLLLYGVVLVVTWDTSGPELILALAAGTLLVHLLLRPFIVRRRIRRHVARIPAAVLVPEDLRPLLDRLGLRRLEVRVQPAPAQDRCYRLGRSATIVISTYTEAREWSRFVLWHEVAHLARRDATAWQVNAGLGVGLFAAALAGFDPRAAAITVAGTAVLTVADRWWSEAACDRLAVRRAGPEALHAWASDMRRHRSRRERAWGLLTHPPLALRTAVTRPPAPEAEMKRPPGSM